MKRKEHKNWANVSNHESYVAEHYYICQKKDTVYDISTLVKLAESKGKRIHAVGSGHSFSDVAIGKNFLIDISKLDKVNALNINRCSNTWKTKSHLLVETQAGIVMEHLYNRLEDLGLAIDIMGGCHQQTLAGAISTGTHGTGINLNAVTGMVRSVVIVAAEGKIYRIERKNGPTNPNHLESGIELVQNDEDFYAVVQGLGCMGIIFSFILELNPTYKLEEVKTLSNLDIIKEDWLKDEKFRDKKHERLYLDGSGRVEQVPIRSLQLLINPYISGKEKEYPGKHTAIIIKQMDVPWDYTGWRSTARNWRSAILGKFRLLVRIANKGARKNPHKFKQRINTALKSLEDLSFIGHAHEVIYQGLDFAKEKAFSSEYAFRLSQTNISEVVDAVIKKLNDEADQNGRFITSPINLRFVMKDNFYISPSYEHDVVYMEIPFLSKSFQGNELLYQVQKVLIQHGGVPHWGKRNDVSLFNSDYIKNYYYNFGKWKKAFLKYNKNKTFSSTFSDRLLQPLIDDPTILTDDLIA